MKLLVQFKKIHEDAQLPKVNHGNRAMNAYEEGMLNEANEKFKQDDPEMYEKGARIGYYNEVDEFNNPTDKLCGTCDTGYDVFCVEDKVIPSKGSAVVSTGIDLAYISPGYWFKIEARSGLGFKQGIQPHPGIVDNGYRGNLGIKLYNLSDTDYQIKKGDRISQLVFYPVVEADVKWAETKAESERSEKGFGSSGN